jgi:LemA protein
LTTALVILAALGVAALAALLWAAATYNRLVTLRAHIRDAWAGVEVELKRRYELIPNLVEVVRAHAAHERETLERVTAARDRAAANHGTVESQARDETEMLGALRSVTAIAENYPDLKADAHFLRLQRQLVETEDRIAAARRFYNGNVRTLNTLTRVVPSNIIASLFGFEPAAYFELDDAAPYQPPAASFG